MPPVTEEKRAYNARYYSQLSAEMIDGYNAARRTKYRNDPAYRDSVCTREQKRHRQRRQEVLAAYGGKCTCCGESTPEFLVIDHINNDGAAHRKEIGARNIYIWLRREGYPEGFQVLCHNCNIAKEFYGACPHG